MIDLLGALEVFWLWLTSATVGRLFFIAFLVAVVGATVFAWPWWIPMGVWLAAILVRPIEIGIRDGESFRLRR